MTKQNKSFFKEFFKSFSIVESVNSWLGASADSMYSQLLSTYTTNTDENGSLSDIMQLNAINKSDYYKLLSDYSLFNLIINTYADAVIDVLDIQDIYPKTGQPELDANIVNIVDSLKLKDFIKNNIRDFIKYGYDYAFINYKSDGTFELMDTINSSKVTFCFSGQKFISINIKTNNDDNSGQISIPFYNAFLFLRDQAVSKTYTIQQIENNNKARKMLEGGSANTVFNINFDDNELNNLNIAMNSSNMNTENGDIFNKKNSKIIEKYLKSNIIKYKLVTGTGLLDYYLKDIFQLYLLELISKSLSVNDYIKNNLIRCTYTSNDPDVRTFSDITRSIESSINKNNINLLSSYQNPYQFINDTMNKILFRTRVLPEISEYTSLSELNLSDNDELLAKLTEDIDRRTTKLLNNLKLPSDIISENNAQQSSYGVSYKWEVIARSTEMMKVIKSLLYDIALSVKRAVSSIIFKTSLGKTYIPPEDMILDLDESSFIKTYEIRSKVDILSNRYQEIFKLLGTVTEILEYPMLNRIEFMKYVLKDLKAVDSSLLSIIDANKYGILIEQLEQGTAPQNKSNQNVNYQESKRLGR